MFELLHGLLRGSHIVIGTIGLGLFWGAALTRKGGSLHRRLGSLFLISVYLIVATSLVSCAWNFLDPESFTGSSALSDSNRLALRFSASLLGVLAMLTWSAAELGVRCVRMKSRPERLLDWRMRAVLLMLGFSGTGLLVLGVVDGLAANWMPRYWACLALGLAALLGAIGDHAFAKSPPKLPHQWLAKHIGCMIGCGIAFHTALAVAGARHLLEGILPEQLALLPWILPSAIGFPAAAFLVHRHAPEPPKNAALTEEGAGVPSD